MQKAEAIALVARAIRSGIFNDLGSGSNVDVVVITKAGTETMRNYEMPVSLHCSSGRADVQNERGLKSRDYKFRRGTTAWTKQSIRDLIVSEDVKHVAPLETCTTGVTPGVEAMDTGA